MNYLNTILCHQGCGMLCIYQNWMIIFILPVVFKRIPTHILIFSYCGTGELSSSTPVGVSVVRAWAWPGESGAVTSSEDWRGCRALVRVRATECVGKQLTMPVKSVPVEHTSARLRLLQQYLFLLKKYPIITKSVTRSDLLFFATVLLCALQPRSVFASLPCLPSLILSDNSALMLIKVNRVAACNRCNVWNHE